MGILVGLRIDIELAFTLSSLRVLAALGLVPAIARDPWRCG
jgi:hypothetical protein